MTTGTPPLLTNVVPPREKTAFWFPGSGRTADTPVLVMLELIQVELQLEFKIGGPTTGADTAGFWLRCFGYAPAQQANDDTGCT